MLCEKCGKNEATFYYHENVNGKKKTYNLCRDCAAELEKSGEISTIDTEKYLDSFGSFFDDFASPFKSMGKLFSGFFGDGGFLESGSHEHRNDKKCPTCGMTFDEFAESGLAGCPDCYKTFEAELEPTISRVQGKREHVGRVPAAMREKLELKHRIKQLEHEREDAVKAENYERAAELRDELKRLRGE